MSEVVQRFVYSFEEADSSRRDLLGGKGAELSTMTALGLSVPPGFVITTDASREYYESGGWIPENLWSEVASNMKKLELSTGRGFGDPTNPLLVSVRSGAAISMPGMMDTILNLGMNQGVASGIAKITGNEKFALDLYRRFLHMFSKVVMAVDVSSMGWKIDGIQDNKSDKQHVFDLKTIISDMKKDIVEMTGQSVPDDPYAQIEQAVRAVFGSWNTPRAIAYRNLRNIPHNLGTAASVVTMVFGNMDDKSGTGVVFSRNPSTGDDNLYGEYLPNAQGEDLVSGATTPRDISILSTMMPEVYNDLATTTKLLERHYRDIQDVEFTVERGKLFFLQTRSAKRSARAAIKTAVGFANEGLITEKEAVLRVEPEQIYQLLLPRFDEVSMQKAKSNGKHLTTGIGASPGAATGQIVFESNAAAELGSRGKRVVLVRPETTAEDVHGMAASAGVLTSRGGATSHAAVVARGFGKPCITGTESIEVDDIRGKLKCGDIELSEGAQISIDGSSGEIFVGVVDTIRPRIDKENDMTTLLSWADKERRLEVWANADNPDDAATAMKFGAEGIGLCRTEHMFFDPDRLSMVQEMILSARRSTNNPENTVETARYRKILENLEAMQTEDFEGIFEAMNGNPVVIRLLDPPLHEFLPDHTELVTEIEELKLKGDGHQTEITRKEYLLAAVSEMREANPMLGMRGCRMGLVFPDIYKMQVKSIVNAALSISSRLLTVNPHIMVPLVSHSNELKRLRTIIEETIQKNLPHIPKTSTKFKIGVMIETPRAAITADEIAKYADFFSFGTNDLTQMSFAFSRDDAEGKFLVHYQKEQILDTDPFQELDHAGVGKLIKIACELGLSTNSNLTLGICGEHGGDQKSIAFFHEAGLQYVSCSPYRVPVARLAAAQAAISSDVQD